MGGGGRGSRGNSLWPCLMRYGGYVWKGWVGYLWGICVGVLDMTRRSNVASGVAFCCFLDLARGRDERGFCIGSEFSLDLPSLS
jgi:hypothetical protein